LVVEDQNLLRECRAALEVYGNQHAIAALSDHLGPPSSESISLPRCVAEVSDYDPSAAPGSAITSTDSNWVDPADNSPGRGVRGLAVQRWDADPFTILTAELNGVYTEERSYRIGADAEEAVGAELARLPSGWWVLHSIPVGKDSSDIDHLAIGPSGVFTINAKHHPRANVWIAGDNVRVNGRKTFYVRNSRFETARTARILSATCGSKVPTVGVIAVVGAEGGVRVKWSKPADGAVIALDHEDLPTRLCEHSRLYYTLIRLRCSSGGRGDRPRGLDQSAPKIPTRVPTIVAHDVASLRSHQSGLGNTWPVSWGNRHALRRAAARRL
jgi:hypothetical protein